MGEFDEDAGHQPGLTTMFRWALASIAALAIAGGGVAPAAADTRVVPTVSFGLFLELGDQAGTAGGFSVWAGGSMYPGADAASDGTAGFVSAGVELRTGMIPLLTGPNEVSPQLRFGIADLGGIGGADDRTRFHNLTFPRTSVYGLVGYRWVSEFGLDNLDRRRKDESSFRVGVGVTSIAWLELVEPVVLPNGVELFADIEASGRLDRYGFEVNLGF